MKFVFSIILFVSVIAYLKAQEPIYSLSSSNLHLINYANNTEKVAKILADNSFEYYNSNKTLNSTNIYFDFAHKNKIRFGINTNFNYQNNKNYNYGIDGIIKYELINKDNSNLIIAANIGIINTNIYFPTLKTPYSFNDYNIYYLFINKTNLNTGLSSRFEYKKQLIGLSLNHLNKPKLPYNNERIPIKYTAFIRNKYGRISSILSYVYQDDIFGNNTLNNYYGIDLALNLESISLLGGYKYLSNFNNIYSVGIFLNIEHLNLKYNFSIMPDNNSSKIAQFHQIGIYYYFNEIIRRGGSAPFPSF